MSSLIIFLLIIPYCYGIPSDNGISSKPEVHCGMENIEVSVVTMKPFKGRMYVEGESEKDNCVRAVHEESGKLKFGLAIGECNMRRQRTLHPRGVAFSFTLVVSFHPFFVTGKDRAFNIRCFFLESVKNLNAGMEVGVLTTEVVEQDFPLPVCTYQLRQGMDGQRIQFAQVGDVITHVWHCDEEVSWVYGILIHSCFADDGQGKKFQLVDDRGCTTDSSLLPQIAYDKSSVTATTHAQVFKYADKVQLYFTCTIQLCYRHDGGCEGVTPPMCEDSSPLVADHPPIPHSINRPFVFRKQKPHVPHVSVAREEEPIHREEEEEEVPSPKNMNIPRQFIGNLPKEVQQRVKPFFESMQAQKMRALEEEERRKQAQAFKGTPSKDSPLNETDTDDFSTSTSAVKQTTMTTTTTASSLKQRRDLKKMETDLSVEMLVLPPSAEHKTDSSQAHQRKCFSPYLSVSLGLLIVVLLAVCVATSFFFGTRYVRLQNKCERVTAYN